MPIWIPYRLYILLPWLCLVAASIIWLIPADAVAIICSLLLYGYAGWILSIRVRSWWVWR